MSTVTNILNAKQSEIDSVLRKKYPNIEVVSTYTTDRNRYDSSGNRVLHTYFYRETKYKVRHNTSSHPELAKPFVTFTITLRIELDRLHTDINIHIDIVDVNYCRFDRKINNKNISIARAQERSVRGYLYSTFTKNVAQSRDLTEEEKQGVNICLILLAESGRINNMVHHITRQVRELRAGTEVFGINRTANTYYQGAIKIGTREKVSDYVRSNAKFLIPDFKEKYPFTFMKLEGTVKQVTAQA